MEQLLNISLLKTDLDYEGEQLLFQYLQKEKSLKEGESK